MVRSTSSGSGRTSVRSLPFWTYVFVGVLCAMILRLFFIQTFTVSSASMEPTLTTDQKIAVLKWNPAGNLQRGDMVVFDGRDYFVSRDFSVSILDELAALLGFKNNVGLFVKRVVALPGDRVRCCTDNGWLEINGVELQEPYVVGKGGDIPFEVTIELGNMWVMGDSRLASQDSRDLLGRPGGGQIPIDRIVGRVGFSVWPPATIG